MPVKKERTDKKPAVPSAPCLSQPADPTAVEVQRAGRSPCPPPPPPRLHGYHGGNSWIRPPIQKPIIRACRPPMLRRHTPATKGQGNAQGAQQSRFRGRGRHEHWAHYGVWCRSTANCYPPN